MCPTLLLDRTSVRASVDVVRLTDELGEALRTYTGAGSPQRVRAPLSEDLTAMVLLPGLHDGIPAYTVKVHAKNPTASEAVRGSMLLHGLPDGDLLAVVDSGWLTAQRTALSAAYVHDHMTTGRDGTVAVVGAGAQGATFARALLARRPGARFVVYDPDVSRAGALREALGPDRAVVAASSAEAVRLSRSVVTATWGRSDVAEVADFELCEHVTVLGTDEPGKQEVPTEVLDLATVYSDDPALADPVVGRATAPVTPTLTGAGPVSGRTVYVAVGLPVQDLVAAWHVYRRASTLGHGTELDFSA